MSLSNLLQKINGRGQVPKTPLRPPNSANPPGSSVSRLSSTTPGEPRPVDPVVARLKAARKAEREAAERLAREKKGLAPKKVAAKPRKPSALPKPGPAVPRTKGAVKTGVSAKSGPAAAARTPVPPAERKPKMSFSELMKKASSIDHSKITVNIGAKQKSPDLQRKGDAPLRRKEPSAKPVEPRLSGPQRPVRAPTSAKPLAKPVARSSVAPKAPPPKPAVKAPLPIRKPSAQLQQKLKRTPTAQESADEDSDLDSFIELDEEDAVEQDQGYDRDEIWAIFNRGKKRTYYNADSDSDDMEATGAEIWQEEDRSKRDAMLEDKREAEEEARRAALKKARKQRA